MTEADAKPTRRKWWKYLLVLCLLGLVALGADNKSIEPLLAAARSSLSSSAPRISRSSLKAAPTTATIAPVWPRTGIATAAFSAADTAS